MSDKMQQLRTILAEVTDLHRAGALLEWDQETYMPPGGVTSRSEQFSTLTRLAHVRFTADDVGRLLSELEEETAGLPFDSLEASVVRVTRRDYDQDRKLSAELVAEIAANNDIVLTAIGDCGSCCSCCIRDSVALEKLGIPSAAIITTEFERETELTRTAIGMQGLIPIVIDHPVSSITQAEVEARAAQVALQAPKVWLGRE